MTLPEPEPPKKPAEKATDAPNAVRASVWRPATRDEETRHLMALYGCDAAKIMGAIESQLAILAARAQTLLSLGGITVTVTGFSGANIARTGPLAAMLLVSGLAVVLASAAVAMVGDAGLTST